MIECLVTIQVTIRAGSEEAASQKAETMRKLISNIKTFDTFPVRLNIYDRTKNRSLKQEFPD